MLIVGGGNNGGNTKKKRQHPCQITVMVMKLVGVLMIIVEVVLKRDGSGDDNGYATWWK